MAMKEWMQSQGLSYRRLAAEMRQSPSGLCKKLNSQTKWQEDDLLWFAEHFGLSADFVIGLSDEPYRVKEGRA